MTGALLVASSLGAVLDTIPLVSQMASVPLDTTARLISERMLSTTRFSLAVNIAATIGAVAAAIAALRSADTAKQSVNLQQLQIARAEKQFLVRSLSQYYRTLVAEFVFRDVTRLRDGALDVVRSCSEELGRLDSRAEHQLHRNVVAAATRRFNDIYSAFLEELVLRLNAWGDQALRDDCMKAVTDMQDSVTGDLSNCIADVKNFGHVRESLNRGSVELLQLIVAADPGCADVGSSPSVHRN
jgi:hypothetical protein